MRQMTKKDKSYLSWLIAQTTKLQRGFANKPQKVALILRRTNSLQPMRQGRDLRRLKVSKLKESRQFSKATIRFSSRTLSLLPKRAGLESVKNWSWTTREKRARRCIS